MESTIPAAFGFIVTVRQASTEALIEMPCAMGDMLHCLDLS